MPTKIEIDVDDIIVSNEIIVPKLSSSGKRIIAYLFGLGRGRHTLSRSEIADAVGISIKTVTRQTQDAAFAARVRVQGDGMETRTYEILSGGEALAMTPIKSRSLGEVAMAKAFATLPDYGQTVEEQVPYATLCPGNAKAGAMTADFMIRSKFGSICVIEVGPMPTPAARQTDDMKRALCEAHGIRYFRLLAKADASALAQDGVTMWLRFDPRAPRSLRGGDDVSIPRGFNTWSEYHAAMQVHADRERAEAEARQAAEHAEWEAYRESERLRAEAEAPMRALEKAEAEARAYWGDLLD